MAEELHFGRAAARLYISQPSLSQQIRRLEKRLQTPLFIRSSRQVHLTPAGSVLAREAPAAIAALERAVELTRLAGSESATTIRLGYTPVTSIDTLARLVNEATAGQPDLTVKARESYSVEIPSQIRNDELDLGLALSSPPPPGLDGEVLRREPIAALLSAEHHLARGNEIRLAELHDETLLLFPRQLAPAYYDEIVAACRQAGFTPTIRSFDDPPVNAMLARLANGREVGLAPASSAERSARASADLVARPVVEPTIPAELWLLWSAERESPAVTSMVAGSLRCATHHGWLELPGS